MKTRRVMLKLSGEALSLPAGGGYNNDEIRKVAAQVKKSADSGVRIGIVIGGGNYWRGRSSKEIDRTKADQIGMLATVMNCIYVSEMFRSAGMRTAVFSPFLCGTMTELFSKDKAEQYFSDGYVLFFAGGTGHPYFSTDTGLILKALELDADQVLLAKSIDGIYDKDPGKYPDAKKYDRISIEEVVDKRLKVIDLTASVMCLENRMPLAVFDLREDGAIEAAMNGDVHGTVVTAE